MYYATTTSKIIWIDYQTKFQRHNYILYLQTKITLHMNEEYNLDNYLKQYIAQHPTLTTYIKWKTIPTLPPPRTPPINIPIPKVSNTVNEERYNFTSVLQSLVDNTHEDSAINSKASLDPSIDCIPSEYAIDNQLKSTNNSHLISIPTMTASYPETS